MKEEDSILKRVGRENAFRVPEGYFDALTSQVMDRLPEKVSVPVQNAEPTLWQRVLPWLYMTAMFVGAALIIRVASVRPSTETELLAADEAEQETEYISTAIDNSMLDDYSLYVYLADSSVE